MSDKPTWMQSKPLVDVQPQRDGYNSKIAAMRAVDDMLGTVVDALAQRGQLSNTLIIVTSDNGFQYGTHRLVSKIDLYEESIRLPMVIRVPGRQTPATVDDWAMNTDWAPTIADYAGATSTIDVDGRSLKSVLQGLPAATRQSVLVEFPPVGYIGGHLPYRMIRSKDPGLTGDGRGQRVLVYAETIDQSTSATEPEFYDLSIDALQRASRHQSTKPDRKAQMAALKQRLDQLTSLRRRQLPIAGERRTRRRETRAAAFHAQAVASGFVTLVFDEPGGISLQPVDDVIRTSIFDATVFK